MNRTYFGENPQVTEYIIGEGNAFRWDIQKEENGYSAFQVFIQGALSREVVTASVIAALYGNGYEQKLLNDYYAAIEGILPIEYKQPYIDFLNERKLIKAMIHEAIQ